MKEFYQYIRNRKNQKIGLVVVVPIDNILRLGWSLCKKEDKFSVERGLEIAKGRAINNPPYMVHEGRWAYGPKFMTVHRVPHSVDKVAKAVMDRTKKFLTPTERPIQ